MVTGSKRADLVVLLALLAVTVVTAPWLRVYYRITAFELELTRLETNGSRTPVPLPAELDFEAYWNRTPEDLLPRVEMAFRRLAERQGGAYELTVRYSFNSPEMDETVTWQAP